MPASGNAISFAFTFAQEALAVDLAADFKLDDTWKTLLDELSNFSLAHGARIEAKLRTLGQHPQYCNECGQLTVPMLGGSCELCGHWQTDDDDA